DQEPKSNESGSKYENNKISIFESSENGEISNSEGLMKKLAKELAEGLMKELVKSYTEN
ncbi:22076_t:CDS:2, partial [Racocetra persica]